MATTVSRAKCSRKFCPTGVKMALKMPYFGQVVAGTKLVDLRINFPSYSKVKYIGCKIQFFNRVSNARVIKRLNSFQVRNPRLTPAPPHLAPPSPHLTPCMHPTTIAHLLLHAPSHDSPTC